MTGTASVTIDVLANDTDPLGENLSLIAVEQPSGGSARIVDGQIEYTPANGLALAIDQFNYTVRNDTGFTAASTVTINRTDIASEPLVELLLNESSGAAAPNTGSLGAAANGVINGGASWPSGIDGNALSFDGASTYIDLGNPAAMNFNPSSDSFSVVMAVKLDASADVRNNQYTLLSKENDTGENQFSLAIGYPPGEPGSFYAGVIPQLKNAAFTPYYLPLDAYFYYEMVYYWRYIDSDGDTSDADWRVVTVIHDADAGEFRVYVDAWQVLKIDTSSYDLNQGDNGANWLIGARPDGAGGQIDFFHGVLDNIRVYDRAISPLEINTTLATAGLPVDLQPVDEAVPFTPNASSTYTTGKTYTFTPHYDDPDTPGEDLYLRWQVRGPDNSSTYYEMHDLRLAFDQEGEWRIRYELREEQSTSRYATTDYVYLTVGPAENIILSLALVDAGLISTAVNEVSTASVSASGGNPPYSFALTGGALPNGLTLNTDGSISGATAQAGLFAFRVTVTDSNGGSDTRDRQLFVGPPDTDDDGLPDDWETNVLGGMGMSPDDVDDAGVPAIVRFALGANSGLPTDFPFIIRGTKGPMDNGDNNYFVIQFQRRRDLAGHTISVKCSTDLVAWNDVIETPVVIADDGEFQTLELRVPRAGDAQKFFLIDVQ